MLAREKGKREQTGRVFNIQRFSTEDGPGIRTTVFLKGCPLSCLWCSNPESQKNLPELAHSDSLCDQCGHCVPACPQKAITLNDHGIRVDRELCDDCGECILSCGPRALRMMGEALTLDEVFEEIKKDWAFYRKSKGGITCSGGEPLMQMRFVTELFRRCKQAGIHTTLDTCGYGSTKVMERILQYTDLVLFDLKMIDDQLHEETTGVSNQSILENARLVASSNVAMVARVPLIPNITDTDDNLTAVAKFIQSIRPGLTVNVMQYHRFGMNKYEMLDMEHPMGDAEPLPQARLTEISNLFESFGLPCKVCT